MKFILVLVFAKTETIYLFELVVKDLLYSLGRGHLKPSDIFYNCYAFFLKLAIISIPLDYLPFFSLTDSRFFFSTFFLVYLYENCLSSRLAKLFLNSTIESSICWWSNLSSSSGTSSSAPSLSDPPSENPSL